MKVFVRIGLLKLTISCLTGFILAGCIDSSCSDKKCIEEKIQSGKTALRELQSYREDELQDLHNNYSNEYNGYFQELQNEIRELGIRDHENLLRNCNQYYQTCYKLERAATLKYSIQWLNSKIDKVDRQISELDQNIWKLSLRLELSEVASSGEQDKIKELITLTEVLIKEDIPPAEAQDVAKIQQELFSNIVNDNIIPNSGGGL